MLTEKDKALLKSKGITEEQLQAQLNRFKTGFPFLNVIKSATVGDGILKVSPEQICELKEDWNAYRSGDVSVVKFVPASGAASRMFKKLFEFLNSADEEPTDADTKLFFSEIQNFAFYSELDAACLKNENKPVTDLVASKQYKTVLKNLLNKQGMNYGFLPKALLLFHKNPDGIRTAMEEHFVEGALYAKNNDGTVNLHFTVSPEHRKHFEALVDAKKAYYDKKWGVKLNISFSEQKSSTDTIAATENNEPFYENGTLFFRPGGHGALIENLNEINADIVFIKNIDNVVPDRLKEVVVDYKAVLAGTLVNYQQKIFEYLQKIDDCDFDDAELAEMVSFVEHDLNVKNEAARNYETPELLDYLYSKLNRPIRVCGIVKNEGDAGGGPFFAENEDGTVSLQILESSQIDMSNPAAKKMLESSTHFNPVDLVCSVKDYKGEKFNLTDFVDENTGFISSKSKNGKTLKALELPGLWNGSMSDWNTIFVEVPFATFNPVKSVTDLLKKEHQ